MQQPAPQAMQHPQQPMQQPQPQSPSAHSHGAGEEQPEARLRVGRTWVEPINGEPEPRQHEVDPNAPSSPALDHHFGR